MDAAVKTLATVEQDRAALLYANDSLLQDQVDALRLDLRVCEVSVGRDLLLNDSSLAARIDMSMADQATHALTMEAITVTLQTDFMGLDSDVTSALEDVAALLTDLATAETSVLLLQAGATATKAVLAVLEIKQDGLEGDLAGR